MIKVSRWLRAGSNLNERDCCGRGSLLFQSRAFPESQHRPALGALRRSPRERSYRGVITRIYAIRWSRSRYLDVKIPRTRRAPRSDESRASSRLAADAALRVHFPSLWRILWIGELAIATEVENLLSWSLSHSFLPSGQYLSPVSKAIARLSTWTCVLSARANENRRMQMKKRGKSALCRSIGLLATAGTFLSSLLLRYLPFLSGRFLLTTSRAPYPPAPRRLYESWQV